MSYCVGPLHFPFPLWTWHLRKLLHTDMCPKGSYWRDFFIIKIKLNSTAWVIQIKDGNCGWNVISLRNVRLFLWRGKSLRSTIIATEACGWRLFISIPVLFAHWARVYRCCPIWFGGNTSNSHCTKLKLKWCARASEMFYTVFILAPFCHVLPFSFHLSNHDAHSISEHAQ
jgi:hypothetical protein